MDFGRAIIQEIESCHFYQLGSETEIRPEYINTVTENPWGKGELCWNWEQILDTGIDIVIQLKKEYFIDHISLKFEPEKTPEKAMLLFEEDTIWDQQTGAHIKFNVARTCRRFKIRLLGNMQDIWMKKMDIAVFLNIDTCLYPLPQHMEVKAGEIFRQNIGEIQYDVNDGGQKLAAEMLKDKMLRYFDMHLTGTIPIVFETNPMIAMEAYKIAMTEEKIVITAGERKGFLYAVSKLWQLLLQNPITCYEIEDKPFQEFRGFHMGLPPREEIGFYKRLIRELLVPMGYNTLFLQMTAGMRFRRHPELNEAWVQACQKSDSGEWPLLHHRDMIAGGQVLEQEEVAELVEYAKNYGLEVIPEIQSLGHVQYITLAHPELAEIADEMNEGVQKDERLEDQPPASFYKHCYCPSNEASYHLLFDIMDEIIQVVKPSRYVHMGHDEVYQIGVCPKCKQTSPAVLYAQDVWKIYLYLKEKGLGMMIWSDMIQASSAYSTKEAVDLLPKDIIMLDFIWYFHLEKDLEDHLLEKGYQVMIGNLYSSHYPRFEERIRKKQMLGGEVSTWCRPDEAILGREGKLYDLLYTAGMLWSNQYCSEYHLTYHKLIQKVLPWIRSELHGEESPSLKANTIENELVLEKGETSKRSLQLQLDFANDTYKTYKYANQLSDTKPAEYNGENRSWKSIVFYHASLWHEGRKPFSDLKKIATYTIEFTDGSHEEIQVEYGGNIGCISHRYAKPLSSPYFRHAGYLATYFTDPVETKNIDGKDQTLYRFEWINTKGKRIRKILCKSESCGGILVAKISGIDSKDIGYNNRGYYE